MVLPRFLPFVGFCGFFPLPDDLLKLFWLFGRLVVLHWVLNSNFKLYSVCCQWTHQGGD
jgi:hypothetical protein